MEVMDQNVIIELSGIFSFPNKIYKKVDSWTIPHKKNKYTDD